jgi:hypothetical protein
MPDLKDLLAAEAARYDIRQPPVAEIRRRRQRRVLARAGGAVAVCALLGVAAGAALRPGTDALSESEQRVAQTPPATTEATPVGGPSQSEQDARRDGVLVEVAALPFADRVRIIARQEAREGVWPVSRVPGSPGVLGDPTGRYGVDWVQRHEYGELLLLDATGTRIVRSLPLPGVPAQALRVGDDAVYCARQGDGGLPNSMLCRADRNGPGSLVRVFTSNGPEPTTPVERPGWERQPAPPDMDFSSLLVCPQGLCVRGADGQVLFHPATLVVPYDRAGAPDTAQACRHIQAAFEADQRVNGPDDPEWETVESEMYAAWRAGRSASDPHFVRNLVAPGSLIDGDTQTLGDATYRLAGLCGISVPD